MGSCFFFYLLSKNGHSLGEDEDIQELWNSGLDSYTEKNWQQSIDMLEEALRLFNQYENNTFNCLKACKDEGKLDMPARLSVNWKLLNVALIGLDLQLSSKDKETIENYAEDDPFIRQFIVYAARGRCVRECKTRSLPPKLRTPDPALIKEFRKRIPYSYLHFAYYQVSITVRSMLLYLPNCFKWLMRCCPTGAHVCKRAES